MNGVNEIMGEKSDTVENTESVPVSGTLDAIAYYMQDEWRFTPEEADKAAATLWLEQECARIEAGASVQMSLLPKLYLDGIKTLDPKAQGMVANSRLFCNVDKMSTEIFAAIPWEVIAALVSNNRSASFTKSLLKFLRIASENVKLVPKGLACVCMRAWTYVEGKKRIPFFPSDILPERETHSDETSPFVCDLAEDDGREHSGRASWECKSHDRDKNYCQLSEEKAKEMLNALADLGVLKDEDDGSFFFL